MVRWLPLAFVACATPPVVTVEKNDTPPIAPAVAPPSPTPPPPKTVLKSVPKSGMTSGFIRVVTGPEDASFVVTSDAGGGLRLWPTLDGSREPLIIPTLRRVHSVDAIHDGDDIALAALDSLGQLEILRITRDGQSLSDVDVALARPVIALGATAHGFVVLRDDQRIAAFDPHGLARGEIDPDPGVRVHDFVERAGHVLAIFDGTATRRRGRMLELDERGLAWGARTATLVVAPDQLALSPSGTQIVGVHDQLLVVIDLATGHRVDAENVAEMSDIAPFGFAFVDERTVWFTKEGATYEWSVGGQATQFDAVIMTAMHVTAHAVIAAHSQALQIIADKQPRYLGYRTAMISDVVPAPDGWVAIDGLHVVHYDPSFSSIREYAEPAKQDNGQLALIDAQHVVTFGYGVPQTLYTLGSKRAPIPLWTSNGSFSFERSTGLAMSDAGDDLQFAQWSPARGEFAHSVAHWDHSKTGTVGMRLYNPAASSGVIAAATAMTEDYQHIELTSFHRIDVERPSPFRITTQKLPRPDIQNDEFFQTALFELVPPKPAYAESSDRTLVAELGGGRMTLRDRDGNERWVRTARGAFGVVWSADDELIAYGEGAARVDLDTGDFIDAHCGWQFGLWTEPVEAVGDGQMCMEP